MKPNYTYLAILVDRSGSMASIRDDAEGGLKRMVWEQRTLVGSLTTDLYQFDSAYERVGNDIDNWSLAPRGTTALLDAMGRSITDVGEILKAMPEDDRPDKVVFVVVTDGMENASREWTRQKVMESVKHQQDTYNWKFVFLAANQDAIAEGASIGIHNSSNYDATARGSMAMWNTVSDTVQLYRSGKADDLNVPEHVGE